MKRNRLRIIWDSNATNYYFSVPIPNVSIYLLFSVQILWVAKTCENALKWNSNKYANSHYFLIFVWLEFVIRMQHSTILIWSYVSWFIHKHIQYANANLHNIRLKTTQIENKNIHANIISFVVSRIKSSATQNICRWKSSWTKQPRKISEMAEYKIFKGKNKTHWRSIFYSLEQINNNTYSLYTRIISIHFQIDGYL